MVGQLKEIGFTLAVRISLILAGAVFDTLRRACVLLIDDSGASPQTGSTGLP
jgi:hypothetical protein